MMIYVFKTSVSTRKHAAILKPYLDKLLKNAKWNFDLDDCDRILRVDTAENITTSLPSLLHAMDITCQELE